MLGSHLPTRRALLHVLGLATLEALLFVVHPTGVRAQAPRRPIVSRVPPEYPVLARRMHVVGTVVVIASVEPSGTVSQAHAASGHALLQPAAEQAVLRWRFAPAPASTSTSVAIQFISDPAADQSR